MSEDYQVPEGFVNPVPDPDEKKPKPWAGRSVPKSARFSGEELAKGLGVVVVLGLIFSDQLVELAEAPIRDALDAAKEWLESQ